MTLTSSTCFALTLSDLKFHSQRQNNTLKKSITNDLIMRSSNYTDYEQQQKAQTSKL